MGLRLLEACGFRLSWRAPRNLLIQGRCGMLAGERRVSQRIHFERLDGGVGRDEEDAYIGDTQGDGVLEAHVGIRPSGRDVAGAHCGVGLVPLPDGVSQVDLHHRRGVAGGRADLDPAPSQLGDGREGPGNRVRSRPKAQPTTFPL